MSSFRFARSVLPLLPLSIVLTVSSAAFAQGKTPLVASVVKGRLVVESVNGGAVRPATASEKATHKLPPKELPEPSYVSSDGKYRWDVPKDSGSADGFNRMEPTIKTLTGVDVMSTENINEVVEDLGRYYFAGWIPDSKSFILCLNAHIAGRDAWYRVGYDINTRKKIAFNGWLSKTNNAAIVPYIKSRDNPLVLESLYERNEYKDKNGKYVREYVFYSPDFYVVSVPSNISNYQFKTAPNKRILSYKGKPFKLLAVSRLLFSDDGKWAIKSVNDTDYEPASRLIEPSMVSYLISLETGKVRKLAGSRAAFLAHATGKPTVAAKPAAPKPPVVETVVAEPVIASATDDPAYTAMEKFVELSKRNDNRGIALLLTGSTPFRVFNTKNPDEEKSLSPIPAATLRRQIFTNNGLSGFFLPDEHNKRGYIATAAQDVMAGGLVLVAPNTFSSNDMRLPNGKYRVRFQWEKQGNDWLLVEVALPLP